MVMVMVVVRECKGGWDRTNESPGTEVAAERGARHFHRLLGQSPLCTHIGLVHWSATAPAKRVWLGRPPCLFLERFGTVQTTRPRVERRSVFVHVNPIGLGLLEREQQFETIYVVTHARDLSKTICHEPLFLKRRSDRTIVVGIETRYTDGPPETNYRFFTTLCF